MKKKPLYDTYDTNAMEVRTQTAAAPAVQKFKYFLVLDFEATCDEGVKIEPQVVYFLGQG